MSFQCSCGQQLWLVEGDVGKTVRCWACRKTFVARPPSEEAEEAPPPNKPAPSYDDGEDKTPYRTKDDGDAPRDRHEAPRRRRRSRRRPEANLLPGLTHVGRVVLWNKWAGYPLLFFVVLGCGCIAHGVKDNVLAGTSSTTPQQLTLAQLIQRGQAGNAHVVVTDFVPTDNFVYTYRAHILDVPASAPKTWDGVYQPIVPFAPDLGQRRQHGEGVGPRLEPTAVQVLVISSGVHNENDRQKVFDGTPLQGMLVNSIQSVDSETQALLRKSYPQTDFSRCLLLRQQRYAPTRESAFHSGLVGAFLLVLAFSGFGVALACRLIDPPCR